MKHARLRGLVLIAALSLAAGVLGAVQPAGAAVGDCGFTGDVNLFDANGGTVGDYGDPAMWDAGSVPSNGQACIPAGITALVGTGDHSLPDSLKVQGTLRASATDAIMSHRNPVVEVTGRIEVPAGTSLNVYFGGSFTLAKGGIVRVESGGSYLTQMPFQNLGGTVDLTGGGAFTVYGGLGRFVQGASSDAVPVQGTVVGGQVQLASGSTLDVQGTGAGAFALPPGSQATFAGALAPSQTIDIACADTNSTVLSVATNASNAGTIRVNPRLSGTTCETQLNVVGGATLTNSGNLVLGSASKPADRVDVIGRGTLVNAPGGTVTVAGTVFSQLAATRTDGSFVVTPTGDYGQGGNGAFELRDGTLSNAGQFYVAGGFIFRELLGTHSGKPIILTGSRLELLGPGAAEFVVPAAVGAILQNPNGPVVIHPAQSITVDDGSMSTVGPVENQGLIRLTGKGDQEAHFGTYGDLITNHGRMQFDTTGNVNAGGLGYIDQGVVNETDGVMEVLPGRQCNLSLGTFVNKGLIDLGETCRLSAVATFTDSSVLRVRSSATRLTYLGDLRTNTNVGGTVEVVTDPSDPPSAGPARELIAPREPQPGVYHTIGGSFSDLRGAVSGSLGYALSYPTDGRRHVQLQVVPKVQDVTVGSLAVPATGAVGDDLTVSWSTTVGGASATPFTDSVLLSSGPVPDSSAVLLGRYRHTESAGAGAARPVSILVRLPAGAVGRRYVVVVADSGRALASSDRAGASASTGLDVTATPLPTNGTAQNVAGGAAGGRPAGGAPARGHPAAAADGRPGRRRHHPVAPERRARVRGRRSRTDRGRPRRQRLGRPVAAPALGRRRPALPAAAQHRYVRGRGGRHRQRTRTVDHLGVTVRGVRRVARGHARDRPRHRLRGGQHGQAGVPRSHRRRGEHAGRGQHLAHLRLRAARRPRDLRRRRRDGQAGRRPHRRPGVVQCRRGAHRRRRAKRDPDRRGQPRHGPLDQ
jgi:hypothetical protein